MASGMVGTMRNIGQTFGVALGTLLITFGQNHFSRQGITDEKVIYLMAQSRAFIFCMLLVAVAFILVLLLPKSPPRRR